MKLCGSVLNMNTKPTTPAVPRRKTAAPTKRTTARKTPTTCVIYTRISKDRAEQTSLPSQERICRAYAEAEGRGWTVVDVCVDQGRSAFKGTARPGLDKAMSYIEHGLADVLLVWKLDRFVRSTIEFGRLWERMLKSGAEFVSVTDQFDTTSQFGKAMLQMAVVFAELESGVKSERTLAWHEQRCLPDGPVLPPLGREPFGYNRPEKNTLAVNTTEAAAIRKAAKMIAAGESLRAGARAINKTAVTLRAVLLSPTTYGLAEIDGELRPGNWSPILSDDQRVYFADKFKDGKRTFTERKYLLSGLLTCAKCGSSLYVHRHTNGTMRYTCVTPKGCGISMAMDDANEAIDAAITKVLTPKAWQRLKDRQRPLGDSTEVERRLLELRDDYDSKLIDRAEYLRGRENLLAQKLEEPTERFSLPPVDDVAAKWATEMTLEAKQMVIQAVFDEMLVHPQSKELRGRYRLTYEWRE